ncbi:MAG: polysaccharide biosynthesis tyrosine autokinase [Gemmatimonadota bacterium]|nr:polysaccharide biosynthesis tyrosine autokinase [Gemmatimonadota bacterium]
MADDNLTHSPEGDGAVNPPGSDITPAPESGGLGPPGYGPPPPPPYYGEMEDEGGGIDIRRYLYAVLRYKWWVLAAAVIGVIGGAVAWRMTPVTYTAEGSLWLEVQPERGNTGDVTPIRASGLLEADAWIELLRSYSVLDTVAVREGLYVNAPRQHEEAFGSLTLADDFRPGRYTLEVGSDGNSFTLSTSEGSVVQRGELGGPVGADVGFEWQPEAGSFPPEAEVEFQILRPRDAGQRLSERLITSIDQQGNFLRLSLPGEDPEKITSVLNSLMERHVALAAELKSSRLEESVAILEEQLGYTEEELAQAEQDLEEYRVNTITLPSDQATPISPGLEQTRDPVFSNFFDMQVELETVRRDRQRLEEVVESFETEGVRIEALEAIPSVTSSSELGVLLTELVEARSELRALRERYSDEFPPVQDLLDRINTLETESIPEVARGLLQQITARENQIQTRIDSAGAELSEIPPRTIEEGRRRRRVQITETLYNELRSRVETARLAAASSIPDVRVLDRATVPEFPSGDNRRNLAALVFLACVGSAMGGALLMDRMDARFRYASDVTGEFGLEILGSIPRIQTAGRRKGALNTAQALEAFRELRIHLGFAYGSAGPITLSVTSPSEGEGKSLVSSNLAVAFAEVGRRTLLIDGDTRRGDAHRLLGRDRAPGLVDYLRERTGHDIIQSTDIEHLDFIGSGSRGSSTPELLASNRLAHFLGTLKRSYDVIIVDSPPLAAGGDAVILSSLVGNLALVLRTGATDKQLTHAKLEQIQRLPIRVLGAILNDVDPTKGYDAYYYTTYLPDYQPIPEEDDEESVQLLSGGERKKG